MCKRLQRAKNKQTTADESRNGRAELGAKRSICTIVVVKLWQKRRNGRGSCANGDSEVELGGVRGREVGNTGAWPSERKIPTRNTSSKTTRRAITCPCMVGG